MKRINVLVVYISLVFVFFGCQSHNKKGLSSAKSTWSVYRGGNKSQNYSPLDQINKSNVQNLKLAWTFKFRDKGASTGKKVESNPIVVDGVLYTLSGSGRLIALDAGSGEEIWKLNPNGGKRNRVSKVRGVTYWKNGNNKFILFTAGFYLYEVNARTGKLVPEFGEKGKVNLKRGLRDKPKDIQGIVRATSPGIIYKNLIIMGYRGTDKYADVPGDERAYNLKTGDLVWTFHTIPRPGEYGYKTWPPNAWKYVGGANDWGGMSLDSKRGIVYLTTGSPSYDFSGSGRIGKNLFANSVIALDAETGKYKWHFQTVHHDLWDYDIPSPPVLVTVKRKGQKVDAVVAANKNGFLFVLNRDNGKPLFPVVEKKVPSSDVPGEKAYPTQPFPLKPKPFANQKISDSLISNLSPSLHDSLLKVFHSLRYKGLFTPPSLEGSLELPGTTGGVEWGSLAYDPQTHILYVKSTNNIGEIMKLAQRSRKRHKLKKNRNSYKSIYQQGKLFYKQYCSSCHGANRHGQGSAPSLIDLQQRMSKTMVLQQINNGGQKMPAFSDILSNHQKEAIIAYLFDKKTANNVRASGKHRNNTREPLRQVLVERGRPTNLPIYRNVTWHRFLDTKGRPAFRGPWGLLSAINLDTGNYKWQIPTGTGSRESPIVTAGGIVFLGTTITNDQTNKPIKDEFRAYDKTTGKLLWKSVIPAPATGTPSTYMINGSQYVTITTAGTKENPGGALLVFKL